MTQYEDRGAAAASNELAERLTGWKPEFVGTLLFVVDRSKHRVLLIRKKRGHGAGKINGPGGKLEPGESPLECARRETHEEVGVVVPAAEYGALIRFVETDGPQWLGHIFVAEEFHGKPVETAEAIPLWFPLDGLPFVEMWEDDRIWLPRVLEGNRVRADFLFSRGRLLAHRMEIVDSLSN